MFVSPWRRSCQAAMDANKGISISVFKKNYTILLYILNSITHIYFTGSWCYVNILTLLCFKGKGDQDVASPGGQMERPVSAQYLERWVKSSPLFEMTSIHSSSARHRSFIWTMTWSIMRIPECPNNFSTSCYHVTVSLVAVEAGLCVIVCRGWKLPLTVSV